MLGEDELKVGMLQSALHLEATIPACLPAGAVGPDHMKLIVAFMREVPLNNLVLSWKASDNVTAAPFHRRVHDGLRDEGLRDEVHWIGEHGPAVVDRREVGLACGARQWIDLVDPEQAPVHEVDLTSTRLAKTLHGEQCNLQASRLA